MYDRQGWLQGCFYHRVERRVAFISLTSGNTDQTDLLTKTEMKISPASEVRQVCEDVKGRAVSRSLLSDSWNLEACLLCLC